MNNIQEILSYFPRRIAQELQNQFQKNMPVDGPNLLEEIRIRAQKPIILKFTDTEKILDHLLVSSEEVIEILQSICNHSIYSYQNQICSGYITIKGGHRIGITGSAVMVDGKVTNLNYISSLNFRISKQIIGASNRILKYVLNVEENTIYNTLLVSPPGAGKTTMLRDLVRKVSNGMDQIQFQGQTVALVDERGEIASMYKGIAQNEVGVRTDILDNIPKDIGMKQLIRSMAPQVLVADEIGGSSDVEAILYAVCCGIKGIFTAHGACMEELEDNPALSKLLKSHRMERIIFLDEKRKGELKEVYRYSQMNGEYVLA